MEEKRERRRCCATGIDEPSVKVEALNNTFNLTSNYEKILEWPRIKSSKIAHFRTDLRLCQFRQGQRRVRLGSCVVAGRKHITCGLQPLAFTCVS
jgi:hypothetical protein